MCTYILCNVKLDKIVVKRREIKLSPKSKACNMSKPSWLKSNNKIIRKDLKIANENDDEDATDNVTVENVDDSRTNSTKVSRIAKIIDAFESNVDMVGATPKMSEIGHKKFENAFERLMGSTGGDKTPSPGRKKCKRLKLFSPKGMQKIDRWFKKE